MNLVYAWNTGTVQKMRRTFIRIYIYILGSEYTMSFDNDSSFLSDVYLLFI